MSTNNKDLITEYYLKYRKSLIVIAVSYTHNLSDAEDLVQGAFVKALMSYEGTGSFLYWINRVMRNDWYNNQKRHSTKTANDEMPDIADPSEGPLDILIKDENRRRLAKMITELPDKYRDIMIEAVYLGRTDEEIAKDHGLTAVNVRQIRSRAKKLIQERVKKDDDN